MEARSALERMLEERKTELSRWQKRLNTLLAAQCPLPEAEAALNEFPRTSMETRSVLVRLRCLHSPVDLTLTN